MSYNAWNKIIKLYDDYFIFASEDKDINFSYEKLHNEINALKQIFKVNGYPIQFIDRCLKQFLQNILCN